jgi:hypothetical protein
MPVLGKCGHCGKSLDSGKKTCGATFAVCNKCKLPLHPHCKGEHRLVHNRQDYWAKVAVEGEQQETRFTKFVSTIKKILSI